MINRELPRMVMDVFANSFVLLYNNLVDTIRRMFAYVEQGSAP